MPRAFTQRYVRTPTSPRFGLLSASGLAATAGLFLLAGLLGAAGDDRRAVTEPDDPTSERDREVDALYTSRLSFTAQGVPRVLLGVAENQRSVRVQIEGPCRLRTFSPRLKEYKLRSGELTVDLDASSWRPGRRRHLVVVKTLSARDLDLIEKTAAQWKERGYDATVTEVGGIQGLKGVAVDTRQYFVAAGSFENRAEAAALAEAVYATFKARPNVVTIAEIPPQATMKATLNAERITLPSEDLIWLNPEPGSTINLWRMPRNDSFDPGDTGSWRRYPGALAIVADRHGGLTVVEELDLEAVLRGVVPSEIYMSSPAEAIKAQAVAARNQLLAALGARHLADPFHLCDTQHCQVYGGLGAAHPAADAAIEATRGQFLFNDQGLVNTLYSALAGGFTEDNETHWEAEPDPSLRGGYDGPLSPASAEFSRGITEANIRAWLFDPPADLYPLQTQFNRKRFRWSRTFSVDELTALAAKRFPQIGTVTGLSVQGRGVSGQIKALRIDGGGGGGVVQRPYQIRQTLGGLQSALFVIDETRAADGSLISVTLHGGGWGHGVGMCQTGAIGMAGLGMSATDILTHYYRGSQLRRLY